MQPAVDDPGGTIEDTDGPEGPSVSRLPGEVFGEASLVARAGVGLWGRRVGDDEVWWSPTLSRVLGTEPRPHESGSQLLRRVAHPADAERLFGALGDDAAGVDQVIRVRDGGGGQRHVLVRATPAASGPRRDAVWGVVLDVTDTQAEEERAGLLESERAAREAADEARRELAHRARRDDLTGLPNRLGLHDQLRALVADRTRTAPVAVLFVDVDRFKLINDSLGHAAGDALLTELSCRFDAILRPGDLVGRLGGDEFVVVLQGASALAAESVADRVLDAVREPIEVQGRKVVITASVGLCDAQTDSDADAVLRDADIALYRAKDAGRDQWARFEHRDRIDVLRRVRIEQGLRVALDNGELFCDFQPEYRLSDGSVSGAEALLRWHHPSLGVVPPSNFVPIAEESGLIVPIGDWVIDVACRSIAELPAPGSFTLWVNVSGRQLARPGLARRVDQAIRRHGVDASQLGVEVTESAIAGRGRGGAELGALKRLGVRVAIDDFGSGYSSLARMRRSPVDVLKVDRSFLDVVESGVHDAMAGFRAIVELGHAFGAEVTAEGVDRPHMIGALRRTRCDNAAGYFLAPPVSLERLSLEPLPLDRMVEGA